MNMLLALLSIWGVLAQGKNVNNGKFIAAVLDNPPAPIFPNPIPVTREQAIRNMEPGLAEFARQTNIASQKGADIIIFPEYGLYPSGTTRRTVYPYLEAIPSAGEKWNPCTHPELYPDTPVLKNMSCVARDNAIYIVFNMGDKVPCDTVTDPNCPSDGRYQYNTNVAFDPEGVLVARYHKKELFFEERYDVPAHTDLTYFDTPFGRIGTFVCFDVLFYEPAVKVIEDHSIDTIAFPTAWMNVYPYFSAFPFHQAFAINMGVNFLASNIHFPPARFSGSGIYTPTETKAYRNDYSSLEGALLISELPIKPTAIPYVKPDFSSFPDVDPDFTGVIFGDVYNFVILEEVSGTKTMCSNGLCCSLQYEKEDSEELYVLGAFRGLHFEEGTYYIEVCALMRCREASHGGCDEPPITASTRFNNLELSGNFSTSYVHPMVVKDNVDATMDDWDWNGSQVKSNNLTKPLVSSVLFGRRYDLDDIQL